jgi:hypothetical protein
LSMFNGYYGQFMYNELFFHDQWKLLFEQIAVLAVLHFTVWQKSIIF